MIAGLFIAGVKLEDGSGDAGGVFVRISSLGERLFAVGDGVLGSEGAPSPMDLDALVEPLTVGLVGKGMPSEATGVCSVEFGSEFDAEFVVGRYGAETNGAGELSKKGVDGVLDGKTGAAKDSLPDGNFGDGMLAGEPNVATEPDEESLNGALVGKFPEGLVGRLPG